MTMLVPVVAAGAGFGVGWLVGGSRGESSQQAAGRIPKAEAPAKTAAETGKATAPVINREHSVDLVTSELDKIKTLSVKEFGTHMADVWLDYGHPDNHIRRALCLDACDGERATAFYREFKRRKGMTFKEDSLQLREFFTIVGKHDGSGFMKQILEASPQGVAELGSLTHGWAAANPQEAVAWLNSLPEGTTYYKQALDGAMWGIAETSPATALKVYLELDPADRNTGTAHNIANSTVMNHGVKGFSEFLATVTDENDRKQFITTGMEYGMREPPGDFVKWMADPLETAPYLKNSFARMANRWAATAPGEAMEWLSQNGLKSGQSTALSLVAASLAGNGKGGEVAAWLAANPTAPGRAAIEAGKQ
jgi:hypothetical protein